MSSASSSPPASSAVAASTASSSEGASSLVGNWKGVLLEQVHAIFRTSGALKNVLEESAVTHDAKAGTFQVAWKFKADHGLAPTEDLPVAGPRRNLYDLITAGSRFSSEARHTKKISAEQEVAKIILCTVCRGAPRRGGLLCSAALSEPLTSEDLDIEAVRQAFEGVSLGGESSPTLSLPGAAAGALTAAGGGAGAAASTAAAASAAVASAAAGTAEPRPSSSSAMVVNWETVENPKGALQELLAKHGGTATYKTEKTTFTGLFDAVVQIIGIGGLSLTKFAPAEGTGFNTKKRAEQAAARAAGKYIAARLAGPGSAGGSGVGSAGKAGPAGVACSASGTGSGKRHCSPPGEGGAGGEGGEKRIKIETKDGTVITISN